MDRKDIITQDEVDLNALLKTNADKNRPQRRNMYILHENYSNGLHLIRCPDGSGKILNTKQTEEFLWGKKWRKAK